MRVAATLIRCLFAGMLVGFGPAVQVAGGAECPARVTFETTDAASVDAGWSGQAHGQALPGGTLDLATTCANATPPCGACTIDGLVHGGAHPERCKNDPAMPCTTATEIADCGGPDTCLTLLGPPQSIGFAGFQLCLVPGVDAGGVSGTIDVESGALTATIAPEVTIFSSANGCPRCLGDIAVDDGVPDGTCDSGPNAGDFCDANAVSTYSDFGPTSFGCPPPANGIAGRVRPRIPLSTGLQTMTLTADSPNCIGEPGSKCFCGTCNNANGDLCSVHADCPMSGGAPGVCNGRRCAGGTNDGTPCVTNSECPSGLCGVPGEPVKPNACLDDTVNPPPCQDLGAGHGECPAGPVTSTCANHPNRTCLDDDECDGVPNSCVVANRRCFLDNGVIGGTLSVAGAATAPVNDIAEPTTLGALGCVTSTVNAFLDFAGGFPGPVRAAQSGRLVFGETAPTPLPTPLPGICPSGPAACRQPVIPRQSKVQINNRIPDEKDRLQWQWRKGAATSLSDLGDPVAGDDYALCVYDANGLRTSIDVPGGGNWRSTTKGFRYKDKTGAAGGITQILLQSGIDGKAQITAKGAGPGLALSIPPGIDGTMRVQMRHRQTGLCWSTTFLPPFDKLDATTVKDRAD